MAATCRWGRSTPSTGSRTEHRLTGREVGARLMILRLLPAYLPRVLTPRRLRGVFVDKLPHPTASQVIDLIMFHEGAKATPNSIG